jgi:hypothetical protein
MRFAHGLSSVALAALLFAVPALAIAADAPANVVCKDGSTSKGGSGACSGHGGVDKKATQAAGKSASSTPSSTAAETVTCKDGTTSKAGKGACSGHGGVEKKAPPPANAPSASASKEKPAAESSTSKAKNTDPTGAIARCKDGTYSHAKGHSGACSSHGGVGEWLDKPAK